MTAEQDGNLEGGQGHRSRLKTDLKPQRRSYLGNKTYKKSIIFLELEAFVSLQLKLISGTKGCQESDKPRRDQGCRCTIPDPGQDKTTAILHGTFHNVLDPWRENLSKKGAVAQFSHHCGHLSNSLLQQASWLRFATENKKILLQTE